MPLFPLVLWEAELQKLLELEKQQNILKQVCLAVLPQLFSFMSTYMQLSLECLFIPLAFLNSHLFACVYNTCGIYVVVEGFHFLRWLYAKPLDVLHITNSELWILYCDTAPEGYLVWYPNLCRFAVSYSQFLVNFSSLYSYRNSLCYYLIVRTDSYFRALNLFIVFFAMGNGSHWNSEYSQCLQIHPQMFHIRYPKNEECITCGCFLRAVVCMTFSASCRTSAERQGQKPSFPSPHSGSTFRKRGRCLGGTTFFCGVQPSFYIG